MSFFEKLFGKNAGPPIGAAEVPNSGKRHPPQVCQPSAATWLMGCCAHRQRNRQQIVLSASCERVADVPAYSRSQRSFLLLARPSSASGIDDEWSGCSSNCSAP